MADLVLGGAIAGVRRQAREESAGTAGPRQGGWLQRIASFMEPADLREESSAKRVLYKSEVRRQTRCCFAPWS